MKKMEKTNRNKLYLWLILVLLSGFILLSFEGCSLMKKKYEKTENKEYKISAEGKDKIYVENPNGNITVRRNTGDSSVIIRAEITKYVTKKELNNPLSGIGIEIDTLGNEIKISDFIDKERKIINFDIGKGSKINYDILVPSFIEVRIDATNGRLEFEEIDNDIKAEITNGNVKLSGVSGNVMVETINGNITAKVDSAKSLGFETTNGNITLSVGENFGGTFYVETVNGKIMKKNIEFKESIDEKHEFKGTLGSGSTNVKINTVNGRVIVERKK